MVKNGSKGGVKKGTRIRENTFRVIEGNPGELENFPVILQGLGPAERTRL